MRGAQIHDAVAAGAKAHVDPGIFAKDATGSAYMASQVLTGVGSTDAHHDRGDFGPAVGVSASGLDDEAIRLMNDSRYGLTAAIWTSDEAAILDRRSGGDWYVVHELLRLLDLALPGLGQGFYRRRLPLSRL